MSGSAEGPRLILASASPRRADLLGQLGLAFEVRPADVDERYQGDESPAEHVERLARAKSEAGAEAGAGADARSAHELVIGGDTVVVCDGRVLGKPADEDDAVAMLCALSGRTHEVLSGIALCEAGPAGPLRTWSGLSRTEVRFRAFGEAEARAYAATGEPLDKAGAYGIQGLGGALVEEIHGDYYTVVGFPVGRFLSLLEEAGWRYAFGRIEPRR